MSDFTDLLHEAEKLTANIEGVSELPKIDRSLRQVLEDSHELFTRVARTGTQDVQANLLLGSQGIDLPRIVQKLDHISATDTFEPLKPTVDTDVPSYLQNEIQNIIVSVIEENFKKSTETSKNNAWEHEKSEWTQERLRIMNSMTAPSREMSLIGKHQSIFMDLPPTTSTVLGNQETIYAVKLIEYNKSLTRGHLRVNLVLDFAKAAEEFSDTKLNDMWEILKYMTNIPPFPFNEDAVKSRNTKNVTKALVMQAKKYLEDRYKTYMTNVINENLASARRGGIPGTLSLARSYVGIRLHGEYTGLLGGLVEDRPLWPVIYYCLRSGDLSAAIHCLKKANVDVKTITQLLETKFKNPDSPEIPKLENQLQFEYRRVVHNSTDPFQRTVYNILCCSDPSDEHSEIAKTADDYLWLKLNFLRFDDERDDTETFRELQSTIVEEYGESHYNAMNQPHLYFQMLALTGQFEAGLEFLARVNKYLIHSVQMAIGLNELHMLAIPAIPTVPLLSIDVMDPKPTRRLNLARLIMIYVQRFEMSAPKEAIHYLFMLRNIEDEHKHKVFITCVVDLAIETREYELLFGKIQRNGIRSKGFLDEFMAPDIKIEDIAQAAGKTLTEKGSLEDAVDLYDIANTLSYIGSIGYIMQGSGFKEALSVIYAPNSEDKMPNGHAYARAVRRHSLLHLALAIIISRNIDINEDLNETLRTTIENNQEEVLCLLRTLLSQVVHLQPTEGSLRQRLPIKVNEIAQRYSTLGYICTANSVSSFTILKDLLVFFDQYHAKQFALALKTLDDIQLIPLQLNEVEEKVKAFKRFSNDVNKVIPDVVLATMNILFSQYQKVKSNEYIPNRFQDASQDTHLAFLRDQAKTLTTFTGMLPYHMPGDLNSRLVQMEVLMH